MAKIQNYEQFIEKAGNANFRTYVKRFQELAGIREVGLFEDPTYLIEISFDFGKSLLEHKDIQAFQKTSNRYFYHAVSTNPPVKAHYHVIPAKGNQEIYAVNVDGTAHHRINKGFRIPSKEADELRSLGVTVATDNIIEAVDGLAGDQRQLLTESIKADCFSIFIEISNE